MKFSSFSKSFLTAAALCVSAVSVNASPITGLFNTGVDGSGVALSAGATDTHYSILSPSQSAIVVTDAIPGTWLDNNATRRWIWQDVNGQPINVDRTFRTTFDLTGLNAATASITGNWSADNTGLDILINGVSTGNTCTGFDLLCNFSVGSGFIAGLNTLDFVVRDVGGISGFLVSSISGTADEIGLPGPASLALLGLGILALSRRQRVR